MAKAFFFAVFQNMRMVQMDDTSMVALWLSRHSSHNLTYLTRLYLEHLLNLSDGC